MDNQNNRNNKNNPKKQPSGMGRHSCDDTADGVSRYGDCFR